MDSYLEIAQRVLSIAKRPMTAKAILEAAYKGGIVPSHLHGRTQHKTLQARLSEDILVHRSGSSFFRTQPGYFFLTELLSDETIPSEFRQPFAARRRSRDLHKEPALTIDMGFLTGLEPIADRDWLGLISKARQADAIRYRLPKEIDQGSVCVWTFTLVRREHCILSYRLGSYRDHRDAFANRKTIGFPGLITVDDRSLFSQDDFGARLNSLDVILSDLDLSYQAFVDDEVDDGPIPMSWILSRSPDRDAVLLVIMEWHCPSWFEPLTKRLSINEPHWMNITVRPNHLDDFEPWSKMALDMLAQSDIGRGKKDNNTT